MDYSADCFLFEVITMKKMIAILLVLITFINSTQIANAASVIDKTSSIFSEPRSYDGKIRIDIKGATVKYVRHAKYDDSRQTNVVQVAQVRADKITGFAYSCPGYYLTRAYSDSNGTKLLGYIRVHVKEGDVTTKGCPKVENEEPKAPPPVINKTHPVPTVEEEGNMSNDSGGSSGGGGTTPPPHHPEEEIDWTEWGKPADFAEAWERKNVNGMTDWTIKWADKHTDGAMPGPHCVLMSTCMYDDSAWFCTTPSEPPTNGGPPPAGGSGDGVPPREQYAVLEGDDIDFGSCDIGDSIDENNTPNGRCLGGGATSPEEEDGGKEDGGGEGCDLCKIFECPGWEKYLGKLYDVAEFAVGDVEPPPIPELERPSMPNIFEILNDVDQRNPVKPTGQDGMGNTPFDATDIKNSAPEIPVREDPTGGFNIVDPLTTLPEDGSTAPRPKELEVLPHPGGSGEPIEGRPKPSGENAKIERPKNPDGKVKPPDGPDGKIKHPIP